MVIKTPLKIVAALVTCALAYIGAVQYWSWKWQTPSLPLPNQHLRYNESFSERSTGESLRELAQTKLYNLADELQSVSMSGAMMVDGQLAWVGTVGLAQVSPEVGATTTTQYRIGSVSKSLTAVAFMRMVEKGLIDLNAPISTYLKNYPQHASGVTPRQLLSHMSGIRHYGFDITRFPPTDSVSNIAYADSVDALRQFKDDQLLFPPGEDFNYSTHGYTLLSAVMQSAGNKRFEVLVSELVLEPLGMSHTSAEHLLSDRQQLAGFYSADGGLYGITPEQNLSNKVAGGGFVSTPKDLVTLGTALLSHNLLAADTFAQMTAVQMLPDGTENPQSYALGWRHYETSRILGEENKVDVIHHGGRSFGADAFLLLVPEHNISVAITTNGQGEKSRGEIQMLAYELAGLAIQQNEPIAKVAGLSRLK